MAITNGSGEHNKRHILDRYRLYPVMHAISLQGRALHCCCGQPIVGEFYQFDAADHSGKLINLMYAENDCAETFLRLSKASGTHTITPLAFFNPLDTQRTDDDRVHLSHAHNDDAATQPLNVELEQAIYLTLLYWGALARPYPFFSELLARIRQHPERPRMDWEVRTLNTAICKSGQPLTAMLAQLRMANEDLRHYRFPELEAALARESSRTGLRIHSNF